MARFCIIALVVSTPAAASVNSPETEWKRIDRSYAESQALYTLKFALNYVDWPRVVYVNNVKLLNICVMEGQGSQEYSEALEKLAQYIPNKLEIHVRYNQDGFKACNIVYFPVDTKGLEAATKPLNKKSVLTISPANGFIESGGIIEFSHKGNSLNFKFNNKTARDSGLKIAPELLEISGEVIR